jgi:hypothetical protein
MRLLRPGDMVTAVVTGSVGVDLEADADAAGGDRGAGAG